MSMVVVKSSVLQLLSSFNNILIIVTLNDMTLQPSGVKYMISIWYLHIIISTLVYDHIGIINLALFEHQIPYTLSN